MKKINKIAVAIGVLYKEGYSWSVIAHLLHSYPQRVY